LGAYPAELQLVLMSKASSTRARSAIREARRLDVIDAPRLELDQRQKEIADADVARDKICTTNKAAVRP
jgi:dihydropteroate synthase